MDWPEVLEAAELAASQWRPTFYELSALDGVGNKVYELWREIKIASRSQKAAPPEGKGRKAWGTIGGVNVGTLGATVEAALEEALEEEL